MRVLVSLFFAALLAGCGTTTFANLPPEDCASEIPAEYLKGVAHDDFPPRGADLGAFVAHAQAEEDNLDVANARLGISVDIVKHCEAHDAALLKSVTKKPWWQFF